MLFPILVAKQFTRYGGPTWRKTCRHANRTASVLEWYDRHRAYNIWLKRKRRTLNLSCKMGFNIENYQILYADFQLNVIMKLNEQVPIIILIWNWTCFSVYYSDFCSDLVSLIPTYSAKLFTWIKNTNLYRLFRNNNRAPFVKKRKDWQFSV